MATLRLLQRGMILVAGVFLVNACTTRSEAVRTHMQGHFDQVTTIHASVIDGDLAACEQPARWLVEHEQVDAPSSWNSYLTLMRTTAQDVLDATDIDMAASAAAHLTRACGSCHSALADEVSFTASPAPSEDPGVVPHMVRHNWALERMWEGLTIPSEATWNQGAAVLGEMPLTPEALEAEPGSEEEVARLAQRVHQLGADGAAAVAWGARTEVYGRLLATCAACHNRLRQTAEVVE